MSVAVAGRVVFVELAADLHRALHDLSQPLTALSFLAAVAVMQTDAAEWKTALDAVLIETDRAMARHRAVCAAAARLTEGAETRT